MVKTKNAIGRNPYKNSSKISFWSFMILLIHVLVLCVLEFMISSFYVSNVTHFIPFRELVLMEITKC